MSAADVPVCAGRGSQARCKYYKANGSEPAVRWCTALYNVVTGEALLRRCEDVRGDQLACGRKGELYEAVEVSIKPGIRETPVTIPNPSYTVNTREDLG